MLVPDGVFVAGGTGADERPRFVEQEAPSDVEVGELLSELAKRVTKMLHAHGRMLDDESEEEPEAQLLFAGRSARFPSRPDASVRVVRDDKDRAAPSTRALVPELTVARRDVQAPPPGLRAASAFRVRALVALVQFVRPTALLIGALGNR